MVARAAPRYLVLQDRILAGRTNPNGTFTTPGGGKGGGGSGGDGTVSTACGLTVLEGAGGGGGRNGDTREVEEAAPPPVVLAVAYREGCVDIALVPAGIGPRCVVVWGRPGRFRLLPFLLLFIGR